MRMRSIYHAPACEDLGTMSSDSIPFQEVFPRMRRDGLRRFIPWVYFISASSTFRSFGQKSPKIPVDYNQKIS